MYSIEVENLKFGYKKDLVIKDISFDVKRGMFLSIVGPNGSGKSTIVPDYLFAWGMSISPPFLLYHSSIRSSISIRSPRLKVAASC